MKLLLLSLLALCLAGCVTVQPCVCPTPASQAPTPDVLIPEHEARTLEPWFDGCNWHTPLGNGLEDVTAAWCGPAERPR